MVESTGVRFTFQVKQYNAIQKNKIIYSACMVSWRADSQAWAFARGKDGEAGLREGTEEIIISLKVPLKKADDELFANFERELFHIEDAA